MHKILIHHGDILVALALRSPRSAPSVSGFTRTSGSARNRPERQRQMHKPQRAAPTDLVCPEAEEKSQEEDEWLSTRKR